MIALLIGSIALGMAAPMITKQIKLNNMTDTQFRVINTRNQDLSERISELEEIIEELRNGDLAPEGAVMFFNTRTCPEGWSPLVDSEGVQYDGYYPRIGAEGSSEIGSIKEQMVHKHKHVSPYVTYHSDGLYDQNNAQRYGPFFYPSNYKVKGDYSYSKPSDVSKIYNLLSAGHPHFVGDAWYLYTSDGMNREETLLNSERQMVKVLTCPNKDEGDNICGPSGNKHGIPYLSEMPLVGNENRPNSIVLLACQKD